MATFLRSRPLACSLALVALADAALAQRWFDAPLRVEALDAGFYVGHADFDGDGDEDLLGQFLGDLTWAVNDGAAGFTQGPSLDLPTANAYAPKVFADFDGDGRLDLAVAVDDFGGPRGVFVYPGTTDGYGPAQFLATTSTVDSLRAAQLDADPEPELAFFGLEAFPTYTVGWIDASGGTPVLVSSASANYVFGLNGHAALDVDRDGLPDQVVTSENRFDVYLTAPGGGLGFGFQFTSSHQTGSYVDLAAGDLDGDGDQDLVGWDNQTGDTTRVIAFETTPAGLVEHPASDVNGWFPQIGFLADWDADGDLDLFGNSLVAVGGVGWFQLPNQGGFDFPLSFRVDTPLTGFGAGVADFDGDGQLDFGGPGHVVFGDGSFGTLFPSDLSGGPSTAPLAPFQDREGDGDVDLDLGFGGEVLVNDAAGDLTSELVFPDPPGELAYNAVSVAGDFDGDGSRDYLVRVFGPSDVFPFLVYVGTHRLVDDGLGGFVDQGPVLPPGVDLFGASEQTVAFDATGDGRLDLVTNGSLFTQAPDGTFSGPTAFAIGDLPLFGPARYQVLDADQDGEDELFAVGSGPSRLWLVDRTPQGLVDTLLYVGVGIQLPVLVTDVGGGPEPDLVVTDNFGSQFIGRIAILPGASFGFSAPILLSNINARLRHLAFDDVDGDGAGDLLVGGTALGQGNLLQVLRGLSGAFDFEPAARYHTGTGLFGFADLDQDGDQDGVGPTLIGAHRFDGPDDGQIAQYGEGTPGAGGAVPVLGATGPVRSGSTTAALRLRRAVGGTLGLLAISTDRAELPGAPAPGLTTLVDPAGLIGVLNLPVPGQGPGAGELDVGIAIAPSLLGNTFTHQFFLLDAASPSFLTQTNGLEIRYGL